MRFLLDMNLPPAMTGWLRSEGHGVVHVRDIGLADLPDRDVFARAAAADERRLRVAIAEAAEALQAGAIVVVEDTRIRIRRMPPGD
jgi:hypothetical protein